ncbi:MAG: septation protein A [Alphaproteobacteria bacterium 32-64-14]|nr:MAG: septation protein A [Alphaproteobacteria bacterium 32-64-14]
MSLLKKIYPFNAEQTVNIASEFGPLVALFVVNAITGNVEAGTWALLIGTGVAMVAMQIVLKRLPIFPLIASAITIIFSALTLVTHDPMWVMIKVTLFNAAFAIFLFVGLMMKKNFFKYIMEGTFHYTQKGWDQFTWSFAWFFVATAIGNEVVRLVFAQTPAPGAAVPMYNILGMQMDGVNVWIMFKVAIIMPASALYVFILTRIMQKHRLPDPKVETERKDAIATAVTGVPVAHKKEAPDASPAG